MNYKWNILKSDDFLVDNLSKELKVNNIISHLLILRGINQYSDAEIFFRPKVSNLHSPFLMKGMKEAIERINLAIKKGEKVLIYGDYDVDGTTSVAMMYSFLNRFFTNVGYYIPDRYEEGYGISFKGIDYAQIEGYTLIIALDCGTRDVKQIDYASNKGIDFIICDHHNPGLNIPRAVSILNPKQNGCNYPYKELSGCGVGFKLIQGICEIKGIEFSEIAQYLDLLALSIGADIVEMNGENRVFAFYGLRLINQSPRRGIKSLILKSGKIGRITMSDLLFSIAPRINAAGRIQHGEIAVEILLEKDQKKSQKLAEEIENYNLQRREIDQSITNEALSMIDKKKKSTVVYGKGWHKGVVGIVASRLIEEYYKPTIVLCEEGEYLTGSARSVKGFNLYNALLELEHLLEKFGGHKYAAGLTIKKQNLSLFIEEFEKVVSKRITKDETIPTINIDMRIEIDNISSKLMRIINQFRPFGPGNREPKFCTEISSEFVEVKLIGEQQKHLRLILNGEKKKISAIGFNMAQKYQLIKDQKQINICYSIYENNWNGKKSIQLRIKDIE